MHSRRILIFANERVGLETVRQVLAAGHNVVAVFTSHPDRRDKIADYTDFGVLEQEWPALPVHRIFLPKEPLVVEKVRAYAPDLILVASWSQIIPPSILEIPPLGTIGVHYSLLPARRGGAPLVWAIIDGLEKTGLTLFYYDAGVDTGDIIDQVELPIARHDTVQTMLDKVLKAHPALVVRNLPGILAGTAPRRPQDQSLATWTRPRSPKDGNIDWSQPDERIYDFVRAQTLPYPCAFTMLFGPGGVRVKLVIPTARIEDGKLFIEGWVERPQE